MLPKHVSFGSIEAYTAIVNDTSLGFHQLFSPISSFSFPCEATTFSNDFKTMYFTKIAKREKKEKIYRAEFKINEKGESGWVQMKILWGFAQVITASHILLYRPRKILIFASDMAGTIGGMDLFIVRKDGDKWSKPENLGKEINTIRNECFPYIDRNNNLFFSSDGLAVYGGYDIFSCRFNGNMGKADESLTQDKFRK